MSIPMSNLNAQPLGGYTRLMDACRTGDVDRARTLIAEGADLKAQNSDGNTALHCATLSLQIDIINLLLELKADPWILNKRGETAFSMEGLPLHQEAHLQNIISYFSVEQKDDEDVQEFFRHLYDDVFVPHYFEISALLAWAAAMGNVAEVTRLLALHIDPNTTEMGHGRTALRMACKNGHLEVVKVLLQAGADPNFADEPGHTPMDFAIASKRDDIVQVLQAKGRPSPAFLKRALIDACKTGDIDSAHYLLAQGANPNINEESDLHRCPLTIAALGEQNPAALVQLLLDNGANPHHPCYRYIPAWQVIQVNQPQSPATPIVIAAHNASQNNPAPALTPEEVHAYPALACERLFAAINREFPSNRNGVGQRSKMKYQSIKKAVTILQQARDAGKFGTATAEELLDYKIPLADLNIKTKIQKALYKPQDDDVTTLKEILELQRIRHNTRSKDFFKKPNSAQKILEEFYPLKNRATEFLESVRIRIAKDKRKGDKMTDKSGVLYHFIKALKDSPMTSLSDLLNFTLSIAADDVKIIKTYTLRQALQLNRDPKHEGKDTQSYTDFCEQFHPELDRECAEFISKTTPPMTP